MEYPILNIKSISERCNDDIIIFCTNYNEKDNTELLLNITEFDKISISQTIETILKKMEKFGLNKSENYVDKIMYIDSEDNKNQLWICRTYLFYQLLIFATATFQNNELYNTIYDDIDLFPYRSDIESELNNFKLGIFGSITPVSDIDIGIQYSGTTLKIPGLAYIVSRFESLFVIFTEKSSLDFDIETYADMMTIPNPDKTDIEHPDYFYLDASEFTITEFNRMLKCAGNSIIRNLYLGYNVDLGKEVGLVLIDKELEILKFMMYSLSQIENDVRSSLQDRNWVDDANIIIFKFLNDTYKNQRYEYYKKVEVAEQIKFDKLNNNILIELTPSDICDIMVAIGDSLTYRMESYTCAPTIMHVVRILQASKKNVEKYKTLTPKTYCIQKIVHLDPYCTIGYYGYILSMLEQFGYWYRFYITYCEPDRYDEQKCKKKVIKYKERYENALSYLKQLLPQEQQPEEQQPEEQQSQEQQSQDIITTGGKKNKRKKTKKNKYIKKNRNKNTKKKYI